jgi:hypothetical protein
MEEEMGRACSTNGSKEECIQVIVGTPKGKRPPGGIRRSWADNIKKDLGEMEWGNIDLA